MQYVLLKVVCEYIMYNDFCESQQKIRRNIEYSKNHYISGMQYPNL